MLSREREDPREYKRIPKRCGVYGHMMNDISDVQVVTRIVEDHVEWQAFCRRSMFRQAAIDQAELLLKMVFGRIIFIVGVPRLSSHPDRTGAPVSRPGPSRSPTLAVARPTRRCSAEVFDLSLPQSRCPRLLASLGAFHKLLGPAQCLFVSARDAGDGIFGEAEDEPFQIILRVSELVE